VAGRSARPQPPAAARGQAGVTRPRTGGAGGVVEGCVSMAGRVCCCWTSASPGAERVLPGCGRVTVQAVDRLEKLSFIIEQHHQAHWHPEDHAAEVSNVVEPALSLLRGHEHGASMGAGVGSWWEGRQLRSAPDPMPEALCVNAQAQPSLCSCRPPLGNSNMETATHPTMQPERIRRKNHLVFDREPAQRFQAPSLVCRLWRRLILRGLDKLDGILFQIDSLFLLDRAKAWDRALSPCAAERSHLGVLR
jgi:hypothetical protein